MIQNWIKLLDQFIDFKVLLLLLIFLFSGCIFGQKKERDSSNFVYYPDKIMIRANLSTQNDSQILEDKLGPSIDLETNNSYKLFLAVDYKFIGFSYGFYPKFINGNKDEDTKGSSKFSEYNFRFFLGKWVQTIEYSKIRGYYVENTSDFIPEWNPENDPYILFPNLKTVKYGMSTSYIFNPNFSIKSVTSFTEWQKKSSGSFIPIFIYDYKKISFQTDLLSSSQNEYDFNLGFGYFYNFIIAEKFYIAPNLTPGLGVKITASKTTSDGVETLENYNYLTSSIVGGFKMGYNSNRVLFGASLNFESTYYQADENQEIYNNKVFALLYFGYRFDAPNFISRPVKKIDDKLKF